MTDSEAKLHEERMKIVKFYQEQINLLTSQKTHDQLRLDIEEIALKRMLVKQKLAEIQAPNPKDDAKNFNTVDNGNSESGKESR